MHDFLRADVALVRQHIDALRKAYPELAEDADLLASTIEGETDFDKVLEAVVEAKLDAKMTAEAGKLRRNILSDRISRFEAMESRMGDLALALMQAAGKAAHKLPQATVSVRPGSQSAHIEDLDAVAKLQGFTRTTVTPRLDEIRKALLAGADVPGARLQTGAATIAIYTK